MEETKQEQTPTPMAGQIMSQMPQHKGRKIAITVSLVVLILAIAGGLWYWFKIYQTPAPTIEVSTPSAMEHEPEVKDIYFTVPSTSADNKIVYANLFSYDSTQNKTKKIDTIKLTDVGQIFGASKTTAYLNTNNEIISYDFATKKTQSLVKELDNNFNFVRETLSPDKSKILYTEICNGDCAGNNTLSTIYIKVYNISTGTTKVLLEANRQEGQMDLIGEKWVSNDSVLLSSYCECDGLPPITEVSFININSGIKTVVALEPELYIKLISISPDAKQIAYIANKINDTSAENSTYTSYIKVKNVETGETKTLRTSSEEFASNLAWGDNENLVYIANLSKKVNPGPGGYFADGGVHNVNVNLISTNNPAEIQTLTSDTSQYGNSEVDYIDSDILILSENNSLLPNGTYKENFNHYVYNLKTKAKQAIEKNTLRWTFLN